TAPKLNQAVHSVPGGFSHSKRGMAMNRIALCTVPALLVLATGFTPQFAWAQQRPNQQIVAPPNPPAVSPYLNLLRRGGGPVQNYFNLTQPQIQFYNDISGLQQQTQVLGTGLATNNQMIISTGLMVTGGIGGAGGTNMIITGYPSNFMNYST